MSKLKIGQQVPLKTGGIAKVIEEIGQGGQGYVYKVTLAGKEYALKWYKQNIFEGEVDTIVTSGPAKGAKLRKSMDKAFYDNLEKNILQGSPNEAFLWPKALTQKAQDGSFGYVMELRPKGYEELPAFCRKLTHFKSQTEAITAAIKLCFAFKSLHDKGMSYQDLNDGNFFIDPNTGDIKICDNDNVTPNYMNFGIGGKSRYVAPEIVLGKNPPDRVSDSFSLAIILFYFLFMCHPLDGKGSANLDEKVAYGTNPVFILDPRDSSNRPLPGADINLKLLWNKYPSYIKEAFTKTFSKEAMLNKIGRVDEMTWVSLFMRLRSSMVTCPHCKAVATIENVGVNKCAFCGKEINVKNAIEFANTTIPLYKGTKLSKWNMTSFVNSIDADIGEIIAKPDNSDVLAIINKSKINWVVKNQEEKVIEVPPNTAIPVKEGLKIYCNGNSVDKGTII